MIKQQFRLIYTISKSYVSDVELIQLRKLQKYFPYLENDLKLMLREVLTLVLLVLVMISQNLFFMHLIWSSSRKSSAVMM